ncbi:MAG: T9SS type A sorting domain-containing protein, partial [Flavobacteriales bacterium]
NFGYNNQTAVRMEVTVNSEAGVVYTETSESVDLISGDSIFFAMPEFSAANYSGYYDISYALFSDSIDSFVSDNGRSASFKMSDEFLSYGALDSTTQLPVPDAFYRPSASTGDFMSCIYFRNPNASRLFAEGIEFAASTATADSLTNLYFETVLYEWNDDFTDLNDPNLAFDNLNAIAYGEYYYDSNLQNELVYSPFDPGTELEDDVRYLFCVSTAATNVYVGFSTEHDYDERLNYSLEPVGPISDNGTWYSAGFGTDVVPCLLAKLTDVSLGVNDQNLTSSELAAFPNPSATFIQVPLGKEDWNSLEMYDQKGMMVSSRSLDSVKNNVRIDVNNMQNGLYTIRLVNNQEQRNFKVLVSK